MESQTVFDYLPDEIVTLIFSFISMEYHQMFLWRVNKRWNEMLPYRKISRLHIYNLLIKVGNLDYLKKIKIPKTWGLMEFQHLAAISGHLSILEYLHENNIGKPPNEKTFGYSARYGHLEILKWLDIHNFRYYRGPKIEHQRTMEYLPDKFNFANSLRNYASNYGGKHEIAVTNAIHGGHLETLIWLIMNDKNQLNSDMIEFSGLAIQSGHLHILEFTIQGVNDHYINCLFKEAARCGRLEIIKWMTVHGYKCDEYVCSYAALYGHLDILIWARENGCPWNKKTHKYAVMSKRTDVLDWVKNHDCPR